MREPMALHAHFNFLPELCVGCGACVAACMDEQGDFERTPLRRLYRTERFRNGKGSVVWYSVACLHCEAHGCLSACPKGCFSLDDETGTVQLDSTACVGCGACARACALGGIVLEDKKARKCDGCIQRLREGQLPRCVGACPRFAINIDDRPALRRAEQEKVARALASGKLKG